MKTILTLSLSLTCTLVVQAQLAPQTEAPLYRHMLEVNAQWQKADPALASDKEPVHFANEAERIARHLYLVASYLRAHSPEGLSAQAATKRSALLNDLGHYADRGLFPQNQVLPYRNPVFIDPYGTACAVGQLMIESGHRDLAESVSKEMNLAYVHDIQRADVAQWATEEGFTEDELAWIQPGYPPTVQWSALGGGTNGPVTAMLNLPGNTVLVAGGFTEAGGVAVQNVALFQGSGFSPLGSGVAGTITCAAALGGDIYLGGYNLNGINDLAHWDGTQWTFSTVFQGKLPVIFALHVMNDTLYAAGETQGFAGADEFVMRKGGTTWEAIPGNFNAPIRCLGTHDGKLVAGGEFTGVVISNPVLQVNHVASLGPGGWAPLADGLDAPVRALVDMDGTLYAGGTMVENVLPRFGLARIGHAATAWEPLMPNLGDYVIGGPGPAEVYALMAHDGALFVGGDFNMLMGMVNGLNLARFTGDPDGFAPLAFFNAPVNALAYAPWNSDAPGLIAGGAFTTTAADSVPYLAETLLSTGIGAVPGRSGIALWPNPATDRLTVSLAGHFPAKVRAEVIDMQGRTVLSRPHLEQTATLDISALAPGAYTLRIMHGKARWSRPFVKR